VITTSRDNTARVWDVSNGAELFVLQGHEGVIWLAVYNTDGSKVLTASDDEPARVWDTSNGAELFVLRTMKELRSPTFSPFGSKVIIEGDDGTARVWDVPSYTEQLFLEDDVILSPDGSRVLKQFNYKTAKLWDRSTGAELWDLPTDGESRNLTSYQDAIYVVDNSGEKLWRWSDGTQISDSDIPFECPKRPTLIGYVGDTGICLRVRGIPNFNPPALHLETNFESHVHPTDPLSFVAGCADGSVRFFRLEGVDLPTFGQTSPKA
jgi:WD40 repeat protein